MFCENHPQTYLIWHIESKLWQPGDMTALCFDHAYVMGGRIRRGELPNCDLMEGVQEFPDKAICCWELDWPLTNDFQTIEQ